MNFDQSKSDHSFDSLLWYPPSAGFARLLLLLLFFSRAHGSALFQLIREGLWSSEQWGSALLCEKETQEKVNGNCVRRIG